MTPSKRKQHIEKIITIITDKGFRLDRYGNYTFKGEEIFRVKIKKSNLRFEVKWEEGWFKVFSKPIVKIDIKKFSNYLNYRVV